MLAENLRRRFPEEPGSHCRKLELFWGYFYCVVSAALFPSLLSFLPSPFLILFFLFPSLSPHSSQHFSFLCSSSSPIPSYLSSPPPPPSLSFSPFPFPFFSPSLSFIRIFHSPPPPLSTLFPFHFPSPFSFFSLSLRLPMEPTEEKAGERKASFVRLLRNKRIEVVVRCPVARGVGSYRSNT